MSERPFLNRRGFLSRLLASDERLSFFAVQVVWDAAGQAELRRRLHDVLDEPVGAETPDDKRRFYKRVTSLLLEAEPMYEYGFVEYIADPKEAEESFHTWVAEIEASIATEEDELDVDVDGYQRLDRDRRYIVVSLMILMESRHPWDGQDLTTDEIYTRAGLGRVVDSVNLLDFATVVADAAYLVPGSDDDGFSWSDFADEGWSYLEMVRS